MKIQVVMNKFEYHYLNHLCLRVIHKITKFITITNSMKSSNQNHLCINSFQDKSFVVKSFVVKSFVVKSIPFIIHHRSSHYRNFTNEITFQKSTFYVLYASSSSFLSLLFSLLLFPLSSLPYPIITGTSTLTTLSPKSPFSLLPPLYLTITCKQYWRPTKQL